MTEPNEQQIALIQKQRISPNNERTLDANNWLVLEETDKKLIILNKRNCRRRTLKKEGAE